MSYIIVHQENLSLRDEAEQLKGIKRKSKNTFLENMMQFHQNQCFYEAEKL